MTVYAVINERGETDSVWSTLQLAISRANSGVYRVFAFNVDALSCPDPLYDSEDRTADL